MKKSYLLLIVTIILFACNSQNSEQKAEVKSSSTAFNMTKAKAFIDSINSKCSQAIKNGDSVWLASLYGPDAEILLEKSNPIKEKDILAMWGDVSRSQTKDWTFTTTDLQGDENFLIETGAYEIKDDSGNPADKGKYVVIWKKQPNGEWKLYRDMGNSGPALSK